VRPIGRVPRVPLAPSRPGRSAQKLLDLPEKGQQPRRGWNGHGTLPGMDTIQDQIRALQTSVRRQRFAIVTLASILAGSALIGAVRPAGDATFDTITCKEWHVVDKDGKARIAAFTTNEGDATVACRDLNLKLRILIGTTKDGTAIATLSDKDGMPRIEAQTLGDDVAGMWWRDKNANGRIFACTLPDGNAGVSWLDKDGKARITAAMTPGGLVTYPTKDGK